MMKRECPMRIPLLPSDRTIRARYVGYRTLPDNYMGGFSLMGLVVEPYQQALAHLKQAGWGLIELENGSEICIGNPQHIASIKQLLNLAKIHCDYSDIADSLYQA